jgi:hypothetical protein
VYRREHVPERACARESVYRRERVLESVYRRERVPERVCIVESMCRRERVLEGERVC